jgi:hypothetical protein
MRAALQAGFLLVALVVAALSLGPSFAHVLEAPPRLSTWSPELWREATVFNGQFTLFATVGAPMDVAAILLTGVFAWLIRRERPAGRFAAACAVLFAAALATWAVMVAPANAVLATWRPGPIPADFTAIRDRWEGGHMAVAALKLAGFILLALAAVTPDRRLSRL